jgi:hypothetical protein
MSALAAALLRALPMIFGAARLFFAAISAVGAGVRCGAGAEAAGV